MRKPRDSFGLLPIWRSLKWNWVHKTAISMEPLNLYDKNHFDLLPHIT